MYLTQEHDLKFHKLRAIFSLLPPIQRLERVTSRLLIGGFVLLTAGLAINPLLIHQKESQGVQFAGDPIMFCSSSSGCFTRAARHALARPGRTPLRLGRGRQLRLYPPDLLGIHPPLPVAQHMNFRQCQVRTCQFDQVFPVPTPSRFTLHRSHVSR